MGSASDTASVPFGARIGSLAPDFELTDVATGKFVRLSSLKGKPVWLNFWATWCPSCKTELPRIQAKYDKYREQGLIIVGIDERENSANVRQYVLTNKYAWTFVVDSNGEVTNKYGVGGIPEHLFVDRNGVVRGIEIGELTDARMEELLVPIMRGQAQ